MLSKKSFEEVHKAVNIKTGKLCTIKQLSKGGENKPTGNQLHEAKVLSRLSYVSHCVIYPASSADMHKLNIVQYHDMFAFKGQIYIIMKLAANNLLKH